MCEHGGTARAGFAAWWQETRGLKYLVWVRGMKRRLVSALSPFSVLSVQGQDALHRNAIGTYIHGSLLPKNPALADHIIGLALRQRYGEVELAEIDDRAELRAHAGGTQAQAVAPSRLW